MYIYTTYILHIYIYMHKYIHIYVFMVFYLSWIPNLFRHQIMQYCNMNNRQKKVFCGIDYLFFPQHAMQQSTTAVEILCQTVPK